VDGQQVTVALKVVAGVASAAVLAAAGCSAGADFGTAAPARPAVSLAPYTTTAPPKATLPPNCAQALSVLPRKAPATEKQATDDMAQLGGHKGNTTDSLADAVAADSSQIGFDLALGKPVTADVAEWARDAKALRDYCN
jgi:hypothetical protein